MRVRTTILLLLLLAFTAFVTGLLQVENIEREKFNLARSTLERDWRESVNRFWSSQGAQLETMVKDFPEDQDVLGAILDGKADRVKEIWGNPRLTSYNANAIWVFRRDGALFYSHANTSPGSLELPPLSASEVVKLFSREEAPHFYLATPRLENMPQILVEVRGSPIRPAWDREKKEAPEAYLLVAQTWDRDRLDLLAPPGNDGVHFDPPRRLQLALGQSTGGPSSASHMLYSLPLRDWRRESIGALNFRNTNPALAELEARGNRVFTTLLLGAVVLFVALLILLHRAVVCPLQTVINSLHSENMKLLEPLRGQKAEFGELAQLIVAFFTQRKELHQSEEMLRHSQKMEAVGRLAGGVAHDFNNLLTAIIGYADLLRQRFADNAAARQPAELIHQAGEQAAGLTRQLLAFSRKQLLQPKIIDLNVIIANLQRLLQRIIGEHIEIAAQPDAANPRVKADPGQIEQVIVNLGVNARDAMPGGGRLTIRTRNVTVSDAQPVPELAPGDYVVLEVSDTGAGMDADTRARIFEPFFTTKGPGKGTGLGLATVYGIVKQSHGGIVVESEPGRGSTFRIYLPQESGPVETGAVAPAATTSPVRDELILVVEDEDIVRDLVCEILQSQGYRVLATNRGAEALRLLREEKREIDLLISDVVMPEMNGAQVARHVHEICPRARVLFVSGYSENDMADQGLEALAFQVLQKPFTPGALMQKVRTVLDAV